MRKTRDKVKTHPVSCGSQPEKDLKKAMLKLKYARVICNGAKCQQPHMAL